MTGRLDEDDAVSFFTTTDGGRVHVLRIEEPSPFGEGLLPWLMADYVARCGQRIAAREGFYRFVSIFPDDKLCGRCYDSVPEDQRVRLFEHET